jgi:hypothetical protein
VAECCEYEIGKQSGTETLQLKRRFYAIDIDAARAAPLSLPGVSGILQLPSRNPPQSVALCLQDGKRVLLCKEAGKWATKSLPDGAQKSPILALEADDHNLVLLTNDECSWRKDTQWLTRKHTNGDKFLKRAMEGDCRCAIADGSLYLAIDRGEFGGGLYRLDLATGKWSNARSKEGDMPVCDVKVDPQGHLWAVEGLSHLGLIIGGVWTEQSGKWRAVVSIDHFQRQKTGWNLGYRSLQSIAFDAGGTIYVVADHCGVCRYNGRCWKRVIRSRPDDYESCVQPVGLTLVVVGTLKSGVLLYRLDTGALRQVALE